MVYYAAYYSTKDSERVKNYAGEDKVNYICEALNDIGQEVVILSNAKTMESKFAKRIIISLFPKTKLLYFASLPKTNTLVHVVDVIWGYLQLFFYVIKNVKQTDTVLVYHSMGYRGLWRLLRRIKRFNYILEVEELFELFEANTSSYKKHEKKVFRYPDKFLFSNPLLEEEINTSNKPSAIISGIYKVNTNNDLKKIQKQTPVKIVYAGSLEKQKGVDYVIKAASILKNEGEIHIIGFGSDLDIKRVTQLISESDGNVSYDGAFKGEQYIQFLHSCDIGVCIQDENDEFNKYEYPSKVFSYLSNGLQVVANNLIQLQKSEIYPYLHIAKSKEPEDVVAAIKSCNLKLFDSKEVLEKLDKKFKTNLEKLIRR